MQDAPPAQLEESTTTPQSRPAMLEPSDTFERRHLGPSDSDIAAMLDAIGCASLDELVEQTVPKSIRREAPLSLPKAATESQALAELRAIADQNKVMRSCIGMGYYDTITPPVILRNILENPGWYTQYTPYQAEIAQGRLEALLNFQTVVADLTGLPLANASLLDEATAAAEAMAMCVRITSRAKGGSRNAFFVADDCHPQTINVCRTRAESMGIDLVVGPIADIEFNTPQEENAPRKNKARRQPSAGFAGVLVQYPNTHGAIVDYDDVTTRAHDTGALVVAATDLLALCLIRPPGEWSSGGADIAVGSAQRFGVPMGFGGPHAAFMATREEYARQMPGRIVGVSKDADGNPAYRLAIQTREQHIKRDRATSNICTAQVLLAVMAGMYAVYHGPEGLRQIAQRVASLTQALAEGLRRIFDLNDVSASIDTDTRTFDTISITLDSRERAESTLQVAHELGYNLRDYGGRDSGGRVGISLDETSTIDDVRQLWRIAEHTFDADEETDIFNKASSQVTSHIADRTSNILQNDVFHRYHAEHELLRYINRLQSRDLSLTTSMIPLGSCTMKLNATAEMIPVTWESFARLHPYAPSEQTQGYSKLFSDLEDWLGSITGLPAVSLQPNAGSQGEYAGLMAIRGYHLSNQPQDAPPRDVCLIPVSAHGTNPASAVIAGFRVVPVKCDAQGNVDLDDLKAKAKEHSDRLGALMITYPSTHGVFEEDVVEICQVVHDHGGQVYFDGANLNALVGLSDPATVGADVCHVNLHKTFCIPHGGGGPGMGPICAAEHLRPFLPGDPLNTFSRGACSARPGNVDNANANDEPTRGASPAAKPDGAVGPVSAASHGSAAILPISWMYIRMMGPVGLTRATQVAILNANYMMARLEDADRPARYTALFKGKANRCAHEFVVDCRAFRAAASVEVEDIAKRLMDYGFHAPTMSWPVPGTLMIEPTESESKAELDRFCDALLSIRDEIESVAQAVIQHPDQDVNDNVLKNAPHTADHVSADDWTHPYARQLAAYPAPWLRDYKFWPAVRRIDNAHGDRHLACTCDAVEAYACS